ncbi:MAG: MBL fold metallo-hydrolase, partial [Methylobacteriaceae bacterium]|nr:MBL fold metallo-hydrolase [Methylobacteriaceae bacterium]
MALWCAFVIETPAGRVYCVGDTAFGDGALFEAMREKHGGFRLALMPIGAYEPRWFMAGQHVDPDEAVRAFRACGAQEAFAHHWGTFQLTDEAIDAPPQALAEALAAHGVEPARFHVKRPGESLELDF